MTYAEHGKRAIDLVLAGVALLAAAPFMMVVALSIRIRLGSPVVFVQMRPGLDGALFRMFKFRTMTSDTDRDGKLLPDERRLTPLGSWLRSTSIDELPELWNVVRGEMSLVGPRPLLPEYLPLYSPRQSMRHRVRPGITGWAQVNGRNELSWEEKFELDVWYVENLSLSLDLRIVARTVSHVFSRVGISEPGVATARAFRGSPPDRPTTER